MNICRKKIINYSRNISAMFQIPKLSQSFTFFFSIHKTILSCLQGSKVRKIVNKKMDVLYLQSTFTRAATFCLSMTAYYSTKKSMLQYTGYFLFHSLLFSIDSVTHTAQNWSESSLESQAQSASQHKQHLQQISLKVSSCILTSSLTQITEPP